VRALLSVYDKTGIADLARSLVELGVELISSGGTAAHLQEAGLPVTEVAAVTGFPEMPGGLVKTLHPRIHGGLLADTGDADHAAYMAANDIEAIDITVVNLYPFRSEPSVKQIDIGGPTMVRASAKNHARVTVLVDPSDYDAVLDELRSNGGTSLETRKRLARKAFAHTAAYDAAIVGWFDEGGDVLPDTLHLALEKVGEPLRYGENPHQTGARYREIGATTWWDDVEQHSGLALSYLNLYDADAAWSLVHDLGTEPAVAIIKHANPCGASVAGTLDEAYQQALECDERSAFGGIVALNRPVDAETVERMVAAPQADIVIAPGYDDGVLDALRKKRRNTRLLTASPPEQAALQYRQLTKGSWLVQDQHHFVAGPADWRVVTKRQPTTEELADAAFAWRICGWVKSNSIVLAKDRTAWGIGAGQQNRVEAGQIAASKAAGRAKGGACASDAFYPFPDGIEAAADAGVAVIIQPGGAQNDEKNIERADELGVAMVFTGERHFLH
jgi:phosphoribosylaminoimidazolecarboxamide formyltransferase/IMP cyclohydrolase